MKANTFLLIVITNLLFHSNQLFGQVSYGGMPLSWKTASKLKSELILINSPVKSQGNNELIAQSIKKTITSEDGSWTKNDTWHIWRIGINTNNQNIAVLFDEMNMDNDDKIFIYNESHQSLNGAYTHQNQSINNRFLSPIFRSKVIIIELNTLRKELPFKINRLYVSSMNDKETLKQSVIDTGYNASLECIPNYVCLTDSLLYDSSRSVCRITLALEEGIALCTGTLMNNTQEDRTPYVLSAFHCYDNFTPLFDLFRFDFLFKSRECSRNEDIPNFLRLIGCEDLSNRRDSDMALFQLNDPIPISAPVFYSGWDRMEREAPSPNFLLHHPLGDALKYSMDSTEISISMEDIRWDNGTITPAEYHYITVLDIGSQQIGSSGGPLFGTNGLIIGQLHGGNADSLDCTRNRAIYGRFSKSWDILSESDQGLEPWLDPLGTKQFTLKGLDTADENDLEPPFYNLAGKVIYGNGEGVPNVKMALSGDGVGETFTTQNGSFEFQNVPQSAQFTITPLKNGVITEGISGLDLLLARRIILGIADEPNELSLLSGDVNNSGALSSLDVLQMTQVNLGLRDSFTNPEIWNFRPKNMHFSAGSSPSRVEFKAYKLGDLNFNAPLN